MKVIVFISVLVVFLGFMWFAWRDGYTQGVMKERRERIKTIANFNNYQRVLRNEISLLRTDLDDIMERMPACTKPNAFEENVISVKMLNDDFEPKTTVEEE